MDRKESVKDRLGWRTPQPRSNRHLSNKYVSDSGNRRSVGVRKSSHKIYAKKNGAGSRHENQSSSNYKKIFYRSQGKNQRKPVVKSRQDRRNNQITELQHINRIESQNTTQLDEPRIQNGSMFITIPLYLFCKRFTAVVDSFTSITKIGKEVARMAITNGYTIKSRIIAGKRVDFIAIHMEQRL